jgi:peptidoglycan/LPS O-acetylase OafA/YrhL
MEAKETIHANSGERLHGLDLLRTLAILMVISWHLPRTLFPHQWKPATWAGVDLFFVLSGYLIGSQLLRPYSRAARPSYLDFFLRRTFRVLPAYLVVVAAYFTIPQFREEPNISPIWRFLTFTQNFGLDASAVGAFSHAWSLCVEEHFYLVLPLIVFWFMRKPSLKRACLTTALIVSFGLILRGLLWMDSIKPMWDHNTRGLGVRYLETIYYPTYTRLDGLLVGVLLAAAKLFKPALWKRITQHGNAVFWSGIFVLGFSFWICQDMFSFSTAVFGYPLLALGFGLLVMSCLCPSSFLAKHRFYGASFGATLAYSTYLTHKEVMHFDRQYFGQFVRMDGAVGLVIYAVSFLGSACVLYFCVERPFLKLRDRVLNRNDGRQTERVEMSAPVEREQVKTSLG